MGVNNDWNLLLTLNGSVSNACSLTGCSHHPQHSAVGPSLPSYPMTFLAKSSSQTKRTLTEGHSCFLMQQHRVPENWIRHCKEAPFPDPGLFNNGQGLFGLFERLSHSARRGCLALFLPPQPAPSVAPPWNSSEKWLARHSLLALVCGKDGNILSCSDVLYPF